MEDDCPNCRTFRGRIEHLETLLVEIQENAAIESLRRVLKVTPQQSEILLMLRAAFPGRITPSVIVSRLKRRNRDADRTESIVRVQVARIREQMGRNAVLSSPAGYWLHAEMMDRLDLAIRGETNHQRVLGTISRFGIASG